MYLALGLEFVSQSLDSHYLGGGDDNPDSQNACAVRHVNIPSGSFVPPAVAIFVLDGSPNKSGITTIL